MLFKRADRKGWMPAHGVKCWMSMNDSQVFWFMAHPTKPSIAVCYLFFQVSGEKGKITVLII